MTEHSTAPKVIVVAEQEVFDLLRDCGAGWDVQHRVETIAQMWDDISGGRLDQQSSVVVFSDALTGAPGEVEATIAVMAPHAATFVVAWDYAEAESLLARISDAAVQQEVNPDAPVFVLPTSSGVDILDTMREVLTALPTDRPVTFPDVWAGLADPEVEVSAAPVAAPAPAYVPAPAPVAAPAPAYVPAPVAAPAPAYVPAPVAAPAPAYVPAPVAAPAPAYVPASLGGERQVIPGQCTYAVTSSKGGSGKSTTAIMLAAQIVASSNKAFEAGLIPRPLKVVLVDMDTRDGQVASLIGKYVPTALNIRVSPQWDEATILQNLVHDHKLGIDALLAPVRPRTADDVGPDFYRHVIRILQTTHDVVIMDTSVNYLDPLISTVCLPEATAILFVTTLATTSVQGMARALREITEPVENGGMGIKRNKIGIVVNQSVTDVGMERDQVLQAALKVSIVGAIPLATKDVLTATNYNRMNLLLQHPLLGPAYFKLAKACMPNHNLVSLLDGPAGTDGPVGQPTGVAPVPTGPVQTVPAPQAKQRGGLFGRKGG